MQRLSPAGKGEAMKWSLLGITHSTFGVCGPGMPSVQAVRCGLPRYVVHGSAVRAEPFTTKTQRTQRKTQRNLEWFLRARVSLMRGSMLISFLSVFFVSSFVFSVSLW